MYLGSMGPGPIGTQAQWARPIGTEPNGPRPIGPLAQWAQGPLSPCKLGLGPMGLGQLGLMGPMCPFGPYGPYVSTMGPMGPMGPMGHAGPKSPIGSWHGPPSKVRCVLGPWKLGLGPMGLGQLGLEQYNKPGPRAIFGQFLDVAKKKKWVRLDILFNDS